MKTVENELYVVIKVYKLLILRFERLFVLSYIGCRRYPYI